VDLIYRGMLRFGRHNPDFSQSDSHSVVLRLSMAEADEAFLKLVLEEEARRGSQLPIDSLIILAALREQRRANNEQLAEWLQKDALHVSASVESLVSLGFAASAWAGRGRSYTLSPDLYRPARREGRIYSQAGFDRLQQEQLVKNYVTQHGRIRVRRW